MKARLSVSVLFAIVIAISVWGCMPTNPVLYTMRLSEVERPAAAKERYGEQKVTRAAAAGDSVKYSFEDDLVSILWYPTPTTVHFLLTNKTEHSIKIIWDEAAFVMPSGESRRILHSGVKYSEASDSHPPSVIAAHGYLEDAVVSSDQCYFQGYWREMPFLPDDASKAPMFRGKEFRVLLPLQIEGVTNEYTFTFVIDDVKIAPTPVSQDRWGPPR